MTKFLNALFYILQSLLILIVLGSLIVACAPSITPTVLPQSTTASEALHDTSGNNSGTPSDAESSILLDGEVFRVSETNLEVTRFTDYYAIQVRIQNISRVALDFDVALGEFLSAEGKVGWLDPGDNGGGLGAGEEKFFNYSTDLHPNDDFTDFQITLFIDNGTVVMGPFRASIPELHSLPESPANSQNIEFELVK